MARTSSPPDPGARPRSYAEKRDFKRTPEPPGATATGTRPAAAGGDGRIFVVQKHAARRLHWDFRLEHGGVLWSWAVPKGPSMDPRDKRLAVHVEDHPVDYAAFEGTIPAGNYGAGTVELWDRGHWTPLADDAAAALGTGELKFTLAGERLRGGFVLVRLKPKRGEHAENWLLIKEHDAAEAPKPGPAAKPRPAVQRRNKASRSAGDSLPEKQAPQLATLVTEPPSGADWVSEIKFDGYRLLCRKQGDAVALLTRNGLDWTERLPSLAEAVARLPAGRAMLDGELVALDTQGRSSFAALQDALSGSRTGGLSFFAFDLLHLDGADLRPRPLRERKQALAGLLSGVPQAGAIRISDHLTSEAARVRSEACKQGLEGIVCKRLDAPYRAGRGLDWVKLKCDGREEFVVVGFTPPKGSRTGLGALQMARYDPAGVLQFAGGVGTGFTEAALRALRARLDRIVCKARPPGLGNAAMAPRNTVWVEPELVAEIRFAGLTTDGMLRHGRFLGLREDKPAREVVSAPATAPAHAAVIVSPPPKRGTRALGGQRLTHPDRLLWPGTETAPGCSKAQLAEYWQAVSDRALPGIAGRPLALVRCPDGIAGEHFFQKHKTRGMPDALSENSFDDAPYLALAETQGLIAAAQIAAIELHCWGSALPDAGHADQLVFDLDPGEGTRFGDVIAAARDVRRRLAQRGLESYPRTSGGKGLHVVAPIRTDADWETVRAWCRRFAEQMEREAPQLYVASTRKNRRTGRILVDWLRNGLGSTAIASYSPRARPGATVATPLSWREVGDRLDPARFTIRTVPARLGRADPWHSFAADRRPLRLEE